MKINAIIKLETGPAKETAISPFLLFATKLFHFISTLYLNEEIVAQNKISANILIPYIIWTFYLTLTSISIFFINNC